MGAINEILPKATGVGKVDPNSDGTGEIFNCYEGDSANVASGYCSHAEGYNTIAEGKYSHAEGSKTTATSDACHAEGESAHATGWASHAECYVTYATGQFSHAEGSRTTAEGDASHAEGSNTKATGVRSHAEGSNSEAIGDNSHAEGAGSEAIGINSHAEGWITTASGKYSHAEGSYTQTFSSGEHAEGSYNISYSSEDASVRVIHSVGIGTREKDRKNAHEIKFNGDHYIYGVGNFDGTNSADAQTLQEVINSKQETITPGTGLEFEGNTLNVTLDTTVFKVVSVLPDSPAQGDENKIHLVSAESTGTNNAYTEYVWVNSAWEILGEYTSEVDLSPYLKVADAESTYLKITNAESEYATKTDLAGKQNAFDQSLQTFDKTIVGAINEILPKATGVGKVDSKSNGSGEVFNAYKGGFSNVASGAYSHAEGYNTTASGAYSHAEGCDTTASGMYSHAEGKETKAESNYSHAEGQLTNATGDTSHAEGGSTNAEGNYSHAEGFHTTASGNYSHAEGYYTQTFSSDEHAEGSYNKSYSSTSVRVIHSVGIGSSNTDRKNAHEIKFNGDHYIYGLGNFDGTNSTGAQTLQEVINGKQDTLVSGTSIKTINGESLLGSGDIEITVTPDLSDYQTKSDDTLNTTNKTVVGAINELASKPSGVGKIDPNSNGTGEIFNTYEGAYANAATGNYSHAEGNQTTATGYASHAEGASTNAEGWFSHAEGNNTNAEGRYSHAEGYYTQTYSQSEHAEGSYNKSYSSKDASVRVIHSVGIGSQENDRKNAHEIKFNGDHYIYGLGGYDGTNATDVSVKTLQRIIEEILINQQHPVIDYSAPDSAFTGTTLINSVGISAVNVWNVENYSRTDIFLLNSSGTTTDKIRYDVVRDTQYSEFQTAHEGDKIEFDEIIQLSTIVTNSFAESDLFIYHAKINDEPEAKYYLVDIVMTE